MSNVISFPGFGNCCVYIPSHVLSGLYYDKFRGVATGVSTSGSGLGGAVMPVIVGFLIEGYSWKGSLILVAGFNLHLLIFSALLRPPSSPNHINLDKKLNTNGFANPQTQIQYQNYAYNKDSQKSELEPRRVLTKACPESTNNESDTEFIEMQVFVSDVAHVDSRMNVALGADKDSCDVFDKISKCDAIIINKVSPILNSDSTKALFQTDAKTRDVRRSASKRPLSLTVFKESESCAPENYVTKSSSADLNYIYTCSNTRSLSFNQLMFKPATMGWRCSSYAIAESQREREPSSILTDVTEIEDPVDVTEIEDQLDSHSPQPFSTSMPTQIPPSSRHIFIFTNYGFDIYFFNNILWNMGYAIIQSFSPEFLHERGLTPMETAWLSGAFGMGSFLGGIAGGFLGNKDGFNRQLVYALANISMGFFILLLPCTHDKLAYTAILISSGMSMGIISGLLLVVLIDLVGMDSLGNGLGYLMLSSGIGTVTGPLLAST